MNDDSKLSTQGLSAPRIFDRLRQNPDSKLAAEQNTKEPDQINEDTDIGNTSDIENEQPAKSGQNQTEQLPQGRLPPDARRALISLLRHGVVLADQKRLLFDSLCRHEIEVKHHLADMYLRLLLDEKAGIALLLQWEKDYDNEQSDEITSLISRRTLSLYDTILLLVMRKYYQEREASGAQRIFVDIEQIQAQLTPFLPLTNNSRNDRQSLQAALKRMHERKILNSLRGDESRFEITPVIRYVVNAEFLERMLGEYQRMAEQSGMVSEPEHD